MNELLTKEQVFEALKPIQDPELSVSIVDLGLIYNVEFQNDGKKILVEMTLTSPGCPVGPQLMAAVHTKAASLSGIEDAEVKLVWTPKWDPKTMASEEAKDQLGIF
ncbi:MAG: metal-sulfur cluster assembly factor [Candidatus Melainabacteria bacterium]|nr:metal-sulfur cluster assembly factor [Candidatus Melainabacteria bacterium]